MRLFAKLHSPKPNAQLGTQTHDNSQKTLHSMRICREALNTRPDVAPTAGLEGRQSTGNPFHSKCNLTSWKGLDNPQYIPYSPYINHSYSSFHFLFHYPQYNVNGQQPFTLQSQEHQSHLNLKTLRCIGYNRVYIGVYYWGYIGNNGK